MGSKFVYVAASFAYEDKTKTEERKKKIEEVVKKIKKAVGRNFMWYLPHQFKVENAWDISLEEWCKKVYDHDIEALNNANLIIFISFGKENNAGAVWEVGYGVAKGKKIICIKMTDGPESLMISNSINAIIKEEEIDSYDWNTLPNYKTNLEKLS